MPRKIGENPEFDKGFEAGVKAAWTECLSQFDDFTDEAAKNNVNITSYELEKFINLLKNDIELGFVNPETGEEVLTHYSDRAYRREYDF